MVLTSLLFAVGLNHYAPSRCAGALVDKAAPPRLREAGSDVAQV